MGKIKKRKKTYEVSRLDFCTQAKKICEQCVLNRFKQVLETYHWTSITEFIERVTFFGKVDETVEEEEEEEEVEDDCLVGD